MFVINTCYRAKYLQMSNLDIVVVPFRQKIRGTIKQLGIRLGRFLEKMQQEGLFIS